MVYFPQKEKYSYEDLVKLLEILRSDEGCPWDREQTHESIRKNFIEEVYEAVEAIDAGDTAHLQEELGDVMLQVVFHSEIARSAGEFTEADVTDGICRKLIERHPHVFGEVSVRNSGDVLVNWDKIKSVKKGEKSAAQSLESVSRALPAILRAEKLQAKAAKYGFDWDNIAGPIDKADEELRELRDAAAEKDVSVRRKKLEEELGDLLFSAVNISRFAGLDAEKALARCCEKFQKRFSIMEKTALSEGKSLESMTLSEMDKLWDRAKTEDNNPARDK